MYAVIETGGKQYRVEVGTVLEVEKLEVEAGQTVTIDRVLLVADGGEAAIGRPVVEGATVSAEVVRQDRADKVIVFKYRPKARRRVKKGHRQDLTVLRISDITLGGKSAAEAASQAEDAAKTERQRLEEAAAKQAAADAALAAKLAARAEKAVKPAKAEKAEEADVAEKPAKAPGAKADKLALAATPGPEAETVVEPEAAKEADAVEAKPKATRARAAKAAAETDAAAATPETTPEATGSRAFEIYEDKAGQWRWRLRATNGELVAMSEQGFASKASLVRSLDSVRRNVAEAVGHTEAGADEDAGEAPTAAGFEIYEDQAGQWRWRLRAGNGELLAITEQGYTTKASVVRALDAIRRNVAEAVGHEEAGSTDQSSTTEETPRKQASRTKKDE